MGVAMVYSSHLNILLLNGTSCNHRCHAVSSKTVGGGGGVLTPHVWCMLCRETCHEVQRSSWNSGMEYGNETSLTELQ